MKKKMQKTNQTKFRVEKVIKKKVMSYTSSGKDIIIYLIVKLIQKRYSINIYHIKCVNIFLNYITILLEIYKLNYIYLIMQQKLI